MMKDQFFNAYIGGSSGVFKGVCALDKCNVIVKHLDKVKSATNKNPVTAMSWSDEFEKEILIGYRNQFVKIYSLEKRNFSKCAEFKCGDGSIVGLAKCYGAVVTGSASGAVKVWGDGRSAPSAVIQAGKRMERMRQNPVEKNIVATAGKENDLKLWDLDAGKGTFCAKNEYVQSKMKCLLIGKDFNITREEILDFPCDGTGDRTFGRVRHDMLEMRVPIWVTDLCFLAQGNKVAVTTRHGHVRLYDPRTNTRRPVVNVTIPGQALTAICPTIKEQHVIVGSSKGQMNLVDLRSSGLVMNKYKGFTGAIKAIACPEENPYIVSVSLDRFFRIHHFHTKELLFKEYVQSKMKCLLIGKDFNITREEILDPVDVPAVVEDAKDVPLAKPTKLDNIFSKLPVVGEKRGKSSGSHRKKHKS